MSSNPAERQQAVLDALDHSSRLGVAQLAGMFDVSAVTIRKDLDILEGRGEVRRVRGGAERCRLRDEGPFELRLAHARARKEAIAALAATFVRDGDTVALDSSTTAHYLAIAIADRRDLVVVTPSLPTAQIFADNPTATVYLPAGVLRPASRAIIPVDGLPAGLRGRVQVAFVGLNGISATEGLSDISLEEAQSKRVLLADCDRVIPLCHADKFDGVGFHVFLPPQRVARLITDERATAAALAPWRERGVPVDIAEPRPLSPVPPSA